MLERKEKKVVTTSSKYEIFLSLFLSYESFFLLLSNLFLKKHIFVASKFRFFLPFFKEKCEEGGIICFSYFSSLSTNG